MPGATCGNREQLQIGIEDLFGVIKTFQKLDCSNGCTTENLLKGYNCIHQIGEFMTQKLYYNEAIKIYI